MGRTPKNTQITEEQAQLKVTTNRNAAKRQAIDLLKRSLDSHLNKGDENTALITEVSKAIGYNAEDVKIATPSSRDNSRKRSFDQVNSQSDDNNDDHNEVCEVCEKGGDLLCCETCSLVFHLKCLRPKLSETPEGSWSCPYCIIDGSAVGDKMIAKKSLADMALLANGEQMDGNQSSSEDITLRISKVGEISIIQSGKKFLVRRKERKSSTEIGRYSTLSEAIANIPSIQDSHSGRGRKRNRESIDIWCTKCFDDPLIELCAFCGCKVCHGKNQPSLLILCDRCNRETHSFCLHPPLNAIPEEDPWCCESCSQQSLLQEPSLQQDSLLSTTHSPLIIPAPVPDDEHDFDLLHLDDSFSIGHGLDDSGRDDKDHSDPKKLDPSAISPLGHQSISLSNEFSAINSSRYPDDSHPFDESFLFHPSPLLHEDLVEPEEDPMLKIPEVFLCSLDSVLGIVNQLHEYKLTPNDLDAFEELRTWGSLQDLRQATLALSRQRDLLLSRLSLISPEVAMDFKKKCGMIEATLPSSNTNYPTQQYSMSSLMLPPSASAMNTSHSHSHSSNPSNQFQSQHPSLPAHLYPQLHSIQQQYQQQYHYQSSFNSHSSTNTTSMSGVGSGSQSNHPSSTSYSHYSSQPIVYSHGTQGHSQVPTIMGLNQYSSVKPSMPSLGYPSYQPRDRTDYSNYHSSSSSSHLHAATASSTSTMSHPAASTSVSNAMADPKSGSTSDLTSMTRKYPPTATTTDILAAFHPNDEELLSKPQLPSSSSTSAYNSSTPRSYTHPDATYNHSKSMINSSPSVTAPLISSSSNNNSSNVSTNVSTNLPSVMSPEGMGKSLK